MFYFTHREQNDVIIRKKEVHDGAVPSGNSVMAYNLLYLGIVFDKPEWKRQVADLLKAMQEATIKYPSSFGNWAMVMHSLVIGVSEVVLSGENLQTVWKEILHIFMPNRVLQICLPGAENQSFPLFKGKETVDGPVVFLCKDYACHTPVYDTKSFIRLLGGLNAESFRLMQ